MSASSFIRVSALTLIAVLPLSLLSCIDQSCTVSGTVVDAVSGLPLEGAEVSLDFGSRSSMTTGPGGTFSLTAGYDWSLNELGAECSPELTISRDGYKTQLISVPAGESEVQIELVADDQ